LTLDSIEVELYASKGYDEVYDQKVLLDLIEPRINEARGREYQEVLKMLRQGYTWTRSRNGSRTPPGPGSGATLQFVTLEKGN